MQRHRVVTQYDGHWKRNDRYGMTGLEIGNFSFFFQNSRFVFDIVFSIEILVQYSKFSFCFPNFRFVFEIYISFEKFENFRIFEILEKSRISEIRKNSNFSIQ